MYVIRWAAAAAFCALSVTTDANAQASTSSSAGNPSQWKTTYQRAWPQLLPDTKQAAGQPAGWSKQEIELAQARCTAMLKSLNVVAIPDDPLHEQRECGTAAPMRLVSIGSSPQVALSPPPTLTCEMVAALHKWVQGDVQPLARRHLGAPVVTISTMSSYSCRNAYGRAKGRLSEHGRANAVDISGFATAGGRPALVLGDWGLTAREIAAQAAAQEQRTAATSVERKGSPAPAAALPITARQWLRPSIAIELPEISMPTAAPSALGLTEPSRLGGPKQGERGQPAARPEHLDAKAQFLRGVHRAACRVFGTVLGPEANNAHKNHFHLDMAERRHGVICE